jgi:hypothetical protein
MSQSGFTGAGHAAIPQSLRVATRSQEGNLDSLREILAPTQPPRRWLAELQQDVPGRSAQRPLRQITESWLQEYNYASWCPTFLCA